MNFDKKRIGSITVSFSWLFMIIIGTFFIILSYNIIDKYQQNEEAKFEIQLKQALRNIFNNIGRTAGIEENSMEPIGNIFSNSEVEIVCEAGFSILSLNGKLDSNNQFLQNYPVFMTYIRQGSVDNTYLAVESFRIPFKVTNMLAIYSKRNLIVFDSNSPEITDVLTDKFRKSSYNGLNYIVEDFTNLNGFKAKVDEMNLNSINFVSSQGKTLTNLNLQDFNYPVNHIEAKITDKNIVDIKYTDKFGETRSYTYYDLNDAYGLLTMAVLSNMGTFDCSYNMILDSIYDVYSFYIEKADFIAEKSRTEKVCSSTLISDEEPLYRDFITSLNSVRLHIENEKFNKLSQLKVLLGELDTKQKLLEQYNCEYVY